MPGRRERYPTVHVFPAFVVMARREHVLVRGYARIVRNPAGLVDGVIEVSNEPGLGIKLDRAALARLHEQYSPVS